ncbi:hypothetical protein B0J12DRAFT_665118 [Macrophomina phaseolina]|uniref:Zinc finger RING/FYVE/PHD-type protein n=1 Tax=Macrophomina phaseolina TaxID=35725 RepID=A0ABQ8GA16_9PEZI|nr:hypothetical protein B0J12DRAFT_665118 [Macrophomina phaseolina]
MKSSNMTACPTYFVDTTTSWGWGALSEPAEKDVKIGGEEEEDWELAWRLQLEDLEAWGCQSGRDRGREEEEDVEFAIMQQVEEIERAEREESAKEGDIGVAALLALGIEMEGGGEAGNVIEEKEFLGIAKACGWVRCLACRRFLEVDDDCAHAVCFCGAQFRHDCRNPPQMCLCAQSGQWKPFTGSTNSIARGTRKTTQIQEADSLRHTTANGGMGEQEDETPSRNRIGPQRQQQERHPVSTPATPARPDNREDLRDRRHRTSTCTRARQPQHSSTTITSIPDDPPPPYPGRSNDILLLAAHPRNLNATITTYTPPYPERSTRPLSREEFDRLRSRVRVVVDALNAVLVGLDEDGGRERVASRNGEEGRAMGCGHTVWKAIQGRPEGQGGMRCCEVCAKVYGVDIWYRDGGDREEGVMVCAGCCVVACGFCRRNRV